jgi:hypothetical protein
VRTLDERRGVEVRVTAELADPLGRAHRVITLFVGVLGELCRHLRAIDARPQHPASHLRGGVGLTLGEVVQPLRPVDERVVWGRTRR